MKKYVVGILSFYDNDLKLFRIDADSEYEAIKKAMLESCDNDEGELELQNSDDYPKDVSGLYDLYEEIPFNILEI